jgi:hypothetical protein
VKKTALAAIVAASIAVPVAAPVGAAAKSCRSGYTHAVIGGQEKCLHAGEFCARRYQRQYIHYHYTCNYYVRRRWHLEHT